MDKATRLRLALQKSGRLTEPSLDLLERCGLPAAVRFETTYRGTTVETRYRLTRGPHAHGFIVTHDPE